MNLDLWLNDATKVLIDQWGLDKSFASRVALFFAYLSIYNLQPVITSGFRDPKKQASLFERWEAGDPSIVAKPAKNSLHCVTKWGKPAALAVDIATSNRQLAANIALAVDLKAGFFFNTPDPVHFYT